MRYIIGIDLGTTNSAVSFVDTESSNLSVQSFPIPQLVSEGQIKPLPTLPSFCYLTDNDLIVGAFAKSEGSRVPTRLVQSAKSWLCHPAANRRDPILPFYDLLDLKKISPVHATAAYLKTIKQAWNKLMSKGRHELEFENQEVILTVPASFDEVARLLTVEAAKEAGFTNMTLLEEPQSAFYSYIAKHEAKLKNLFKPSDLVLVVDVGGGTTDFSLIEVQVNEGVQNFQRMAVGDHLLLGGDNMDAAIAYQLQQKLPELTSVQKLQLLAEARSAKEFLLSEEGDVYKCVLQGQGSHVILGSVQLEITKAEIEDLLLNGFFAFSPFETCKTLKKTAGIKYVGLPFEDEPSIIKQLGHFLHQAGDKKPDFVLFNGGTMKPSLFREAVVNAINSWFPEKTVKVLESVDLDLAVSRGASYYGKVRRGLGVRISGGAARGYYLAVNEGGIQKALCILPRGSEEGASYEPDQTFFVTPNKPVSFQLYTSHVRLSDSQGELIEMTSEEMQKLPEIRTVLRFGKKQLTDLSKEKIPVHLKVSLTAIGTLEIYLLSQISDHKWALEFQLKNASAQDNALNLLTKTKEDETFDADYLNPVKNLIEEAFSKNGKLENLMEGIEKELGITKKDFPPSVLRALFDTLLLKGEGRLISPNHMTRFYNLAGFFLRPGTGYPLDDFRVKNLWKLILQDAKANKNFETQIQQLVCYRRIAMGLSKGQQMQLLNEVIPELKNGKIEIKAKSENYHYSEKIRAFGAFELLDVSVKTKIGQAILERIQKGTALDADYFALGRIGARHLVYGTLTQLIPLKTVIQWIERLLETKTIPEDKLAFLLGLLGRKTDLPEVNIPADLVQKILTRFATSSHLELLKTRLTTLDHLSAKEEAEVFGETLPLGLHLENS